MRVEGDGEPRMLRDGSVLPLGDVPTCMRTCAPHALVYPDGLRMSACDDWVDPDRSCISVSGHRVVYHDRSGKVHTLSVVTSDVAREDQDLDGTVRAQQLDGTEPRRLTLTFHVGRNVALAPAPCAPGEPGGADAGSPF